MIRSIFTVFYVLLYSQLKKKNSWENLLVVSFETWRYNKHGDIFIMGI